MATDASERGRVPAQHLKVLVTGPFASGKSTLIETISEIGVVSTEKTITDQSSGAKRNTTVAMDFGRITFGGDLALHIFGTPGQKRFEVLWEVLSRGMLGFVFLVDASDRTSTAEAAHMLEVFRGYADVPFVVGATHLDLAEGPTETILRELRETLGLPKETYVLPCDPREKSQVTQTVLTLLHQVLERLERRASRGRG